MAKANKNAIVLGLSGSIGDLVFRQMPDGSTRVSRKPDFSRRVFSQGQKDHQSRFQQAAAYARQAAKTQPIYAELARGTAKSAYNVALSDWFNPPVIHRIERREGVDQSGGQRQRHGDEGSDRDCGCRRESFGAGRGQAGGFRLVGICSQRQRERSRRRPGTWQAIRRSRFYSKEFKKTLAAILTKGHLREAFRIKCHLPYFMAEQQ